MNEAELSRIQLLLNTRRHEQAGTELARILASNPDSFLGHYFMSLVRNQQDDHEQAVYHAKECIRVAPDAPLGHYALGVARMEEEEYDEALEHASEAIRLDPSDAELFNLKAGILYRQRKHQEALDTVEHALSLDPEDLRLLNLRSVLLVRLNRTEEAADTADSALQKDPENSLAHTNKGWTCLHQNDPKQAAVHFQEALRLDPGNEWARDGLKETIKARNWAYRGLLAYFLWTTRMSNRNRWIMIIGLYAAYRLLLYASERVPGLAPFLYPLIGAYVLFAISTWIGTPLSNLFLRFHPVGRHALDRDEKVGATLVGSLLLGGILFLAGYFVLDTQLLLLLAIWALAMMIPASGTFMVPADHKARRRVDLFALAIAVAGLAGILIPGAITLLFASLVGVFFFSIGMNWIISRS